MATSETKAAFAQHIIDYYEITLIGPTALGELMGMHRVNAGMTLQILGWQRLLPSYHTPGGSLWEKQGAEKEFRYQGAALKMFRRWLRRNEQA